MDEYGCYRDVEEDYDSLAEHLEDSTSLVFAWSRDQVSAYVVILSESFRKLGTLPYGGNPQGSCLVSVLMRGAFWFDLNRTEEIHEEYVGEKLNLGTGEDAKNIACLINGLRKARAK